MFFLRNSVNVNKMFKSKRVFSNLNNCCNLDFETKKKIQIMYILTPSFYALSIGTWVLTIISMFTK